MGKAKLKRQQFRIVFFGGVRMERRRCRECGRWSLVTASGWQCSECGAEPEDAKFKGVYRESEGHASRGNFRPKKAERERLLGLQENRCAYCWRTFGSSVVDVARGRKVSLRVEWDHFVPWAYARTHLVDFVAACQICNQIKGDRMFESMDEATHYVVTRREARYA